MSEGKYAVTVKVIATFTYTVEVEGRTEPSAEAEATKRSVLAANLPEDFQVERGYCDFETEAVQLTAYCPECSREHSVSNNGPLLLEPWHEDPDYCADCGAKIVAGTLTL